MYQFPLSTDQVAQFHGEIASHAALRATLTAGLQQPTLWTINVGDAAETWKLRTRNAGENDDDASFILPADSGPTNNVIWVRVS